MPWPLVLAGPRVTSEHTTVREDMAPVVRIEREEAQMRDENGPRSLAELSDTAEDSENVKKQAPG